MSLSISNVIIIGAGPSGYTSAIYAARAKLEPILFSGPQKGGQLTTTTTVENYPGFEGIDGYELTEKMMNQAINNGTKIIDETVIKIHTSTPFCIETDKSKYYTKSIIIASGASVKKLQIPGADKFWMNGISGCAVCDGPLPFFRNKHLIVVGGGDTACEEAIFLTKFTSQVTIIHRRDKFRASKIMQEKVLKNSNIKVIWNSDIINIKGDDKVSSIMIKNNKTVQEDEINCSGIFYAIGHTPNTEFIKNNDIVCDEIGYIITEPGTSKTSHKGIFACGDVMDKKYRQVSTCIGMGFIAFHDTNEYLMNQDL